MIKKIKTKGMHCPSCEKLIEKAALKLEGVKSAKSDFAREETEIEFDENVTNLGMIIDAIDNKGYECCKIKEEQVQIEVNKGTEDEPATEESRIPEYSKIKEEKLDDEYYYMPKINPKYLFIAGGLLFLLGLYWIINHAFSFNFPTITPGMGLAVIFVVGLLTSLHCIGMCGGFVLSYTTKEAMDENQKKKSKFFSHFKYGAGKTITYVILGALFGLLGSFVTFSPKLT
jgi:copper chaperone CopZ